MSIGMGEILIIIIIILVLYKPKDIPKIINKIIKYKKQINKNFEKIKKLIQK